MEKIKTRLSHKDKVIIKHFIKFLRKHGALIPFCSNLALLYKDGNLSKHLQKVAFSNPNKIKFPEEIIEASFRWYLTKEGGEYWSSIASYWHHYCKTILTPILMQNTPKPTMVKLEVKWQNGTKQIYHITGRNVEQVRERLLAKIGGTKLPYGVRKQILERFYAVKK